MRTDTLESRIKSIKKEVIHLLYCLLIWFIYLKNLKIQKIMW